MKGICNCKTGYSGPSCSVNFCTATQFYDPTTGTCLGGCPSGTFANVFNRNCDSCQSPCSECAMTPTTCTACPGGIKVLHLGSCIDACPSSYYDNGGFCTQCHGSCLECSGITLDDCISCPAVGGVCSAYLSSLTVSSPSVGSCISECSGRNDHADGFNCKCLQNQCPYNLIRTVNGSTNFLCNLCPDPNYYNTDSASCVASTSCAAGTFARESDRFCAQCFASTCLTCNGIFSTNCVTCQVATPFLYLGACVISSACGLGTFPDTSSALRVCAFCPTGCTSCTAASCLSCFGPTAAVSSGYYHSGTACNPGCLSHEYQNDAQRICEPCDFSCLTCDSSKNSGCLSCTGTAYLYTNTSGSFCVQVCPGIGFYPDPGNVCKPCHVSCHTCSGTLSSNCNSCAGSYYLHASACNYFCPKGFYRSSETNDCLGCHADCSFCFQGGAEGCLSCATGKFLHNSSCLVRCPEGT